MNSEWHEIKIEEIAKSIAMGPFGSDIKTDNFVPEGVPVIRGGNLSDGGFQDEGFVFLTEAKADQLRTANAFANDLIFTHRGTLGQISIIPPNAKFPRYVVSQSQMRLTCDTSKVDPSFLYYFFRSSEGQHKLLVNTSQTGVPAISRPVTSLKAIRLNLPPLSEQKVIARILGSLDDKIELNRQMNATLELLAQTLFRAWFVDFEPVKAKAAGLQPIAMDSETAALFPSEFEERALGPIPKGWTSSTLDQLFTIHGGGTPKTTEPSYWGGDIPWFSVVDAPNETDVFVIDTEKKITLEGLKNSSTKLLEKGTTIISARGTVGRLAIVTKPMAMNQSCYGLEAKDGVFFTFYSVKNAVLELKQNTHGAVFDTITQNTFKAIKGVLPPNEIIQKFESSVDPIMQRIEANLRESQTLAQIRDSLLPRLISGQLRVPEAMEEVEAF